MDTAQREVLEGLPERAEVLRIKQEVLTDALLTMEKISKHDAAVRIVGLGVIGLVGVFAIHTMYRDKKEKSDG